MPEPIQLKKSGGLGRISQCYLDDMQYICSVKGYSLYMEVCEPSVYMDDDADSDVYICLVDMSKPSYKKIVSQVWLSHVKNGYYTIDMVQVSKHYSGQGISYAMYKAILKNTTIKLVCGDIQSPGGRYIWRKLIQSKAVSVKAGAIKKHSRKYDVKLSGKTDVYAVTKNWLIDIYSDDYSDYRLFAEVL